MYLRIFSFIKNEAHLIEDWLKHHGPLVNWWGLHVIDNGSTDGTTMILNRYKKKYGINIHECKDFKSKGTRITELIRGYNKQSGISFALDADEFICLWQNNQVSKDIFKIKKYLISIYDNGSIFRTKGWLTCVPEQEEYSHPVAQITKFKWQSTDQTRCKKFVRNDKFTKYDLGHHQPTSTDMQQVDTDIVYLHYHGCSKSLRKRRCEELIVQHGMDLSSLQNQASQTPDVYKHVKKSFAGRDRAEEYMNQANWSYTPTEDFDVTI